MSCSERVQGRRQRWGTRRQDVPKSPFAIINVWNRPACRYLLLHPIAAPPQPVAFILSPYIQTAVQVLIKESRKPLLVNHKQCFGLHLYITAACKEGAICANHGLSLTKG